MPPRQRPTPDMGGRIVDLYPANPLISVIVLAETVSESALSGTVLEVMRSIRQSSNVRLRERDFSVFLCRWIVHDGRRCVGIGLPHKFDSRLDRLFLRRISSLAPVEEISDSLAQDVGATPLARYLCGNLVMYVGPLDTNVTTEIERPAFAPSYGGWGSRVRPVWARNASMRAGRYWMRLSRFLMIAARRSTSAAARLPRPFFMFDQAPSTGLSSGA